MGVGPGSERGKIRAMTEKDPTDDPRASVDELIARLAWGSRTEDGGVRFAGRREPGRALAALVGLGGQAVGPLLGALHRGLGVGSGAAEALGLIGDERAVGPLLEALADEQDSDLRREAARALGRLGDRRAAEPLILALADEDEHVRWAAAGALGEVGYPDALEALCDLVQRQGGSWLGLDEEEDYEAAEWLSGELARLAAYALGRIGEPEGVAPLLEALSDSHPEVRWQAAEALGEIGQPEALPELERLAREDHEPADEGPVCEAARQAAAHIRGRRRPVRVFREEPSTAVLYKYLSPSAVVALEKRSLRFTPASRFNDPFELFTSLDAFIRPLLTALHTERLRTEHRRRTLAVMMGPDFGDLAHDLGLVHAIEEDFRRDDSAPVRAIREAVEHAVRSATKVSPEARARAAAARRALDERFGVLCLAERPDDVLMWSHYADHHRGLVFELDAASPFFDRRRHEHDPIRRVRPVQYQSTRPSRGLFDPKYWWRSRRTAAKDLADYAAGLLLLLKSQDWAGEREWRMILPLAEVDEVVENDGETLHLCRIPPEALRSVILGCRASEEDRAAVRRLLDHPDYSHVTLKRSEMHGQKFELLIKDDESVAERALLEDVGAFPGDGIQQRIDRLGLGGRRFYAALSVLEAKGWIDAPAPDRSKRGKRVLRLTDAGRAALGS